MSSDGTTTQRGYGYVHMRTRAEWKPYVDAGLVDCWRCGLLITPRPWLKGDGWHLGHDDHDRTIYRGPEHSECNTGRGRRKGQGDGTPWSTVSNPSRQW